MQYGVQGHEFPAEALCMGVGYTPTVSIRLPVRPSKNDMMYLCHFSIFFDHS